MADIKASPLNHVFSPKELKQQCKAIYGGVSWPGKRPGFVAIVGMSRNKHLDNYDIYLLAEYESIYIREIVRQSGVLDFEYQPKVWYGDNQNDAADEFIREMNQEFTSSENSQEHQRHFSVHSTRILEMEKVYPYILESTRRLLDKNRRQLYLKESKILGYLNNISPLDASALEFGDYPALEALAFSVLEMRRHGGQLAMKKDKPDQYDEIPESGSVWSN